MEDFVKARLRHSSAGSLVPLSLIAAAAMSACSHGATPVSQVAPAAGPAAPMVSTQTLVTPADSKLAPSKITYVARLFSEGQAHRLGWRTLELSDATYEGATVWMLAESRKINTVTLADTLYVSKATLEPLHRVVYTADDQVTTHYTRDSIVTSFKSDSGVTRVAIPNEPNLVGNIYWLEPLFASLPLANGWKGSAYTVFVGPRDHAKVELQMSVTGEERIPAPDGDFDCWTMTLKVGETEEHLWVRKSDHVLIKEDTPVAGIAGAKVQLLLAEGQTKKP
jgi:hypothetical protein